MEAGINIYQYADNAPGVWRDPLGLEPGKPYTSTDSAAKAATDYAWEQSRKSASEPSAPGQDAGPWEYGGYIYEDVTTRPHTYYHDEPKTSKHNKRWFPEPPDVQPDRIPVAEYHVHPVDPDGSSDEGYEEFSPCDKYRACRRDWPSYVRTPKGRCRKYDPKRYPDRCDWWRQNPPQCGQ